MKLLFDANLSWRLVSKLKIQFPHSKHVDHIGLVLPPSDTEIWEFAKEHGLIIVTNDEDFLNLMNVKGYPPKVILLKTGNQSTSFIENILSKHAVDIEVLYDNEETGLLEIY